jgi:hypothetical protein
MQEIIIPTDAIKDDFQEFLCAEANTRVFLSGKFGIGKTYFLTEFFKLRSEEYEAFHLYPVNYQISSNGDILELIKYDLLIELIKRNEEIFKTNEVNGVKDSWLLFYSWCKNRFSINSLIKNVLNVSNLVPEVASDPTLAMFEKLGRPLQDVLKIDEEFQEFKKKYKEGEKGDAKKYLDAIKSKNISEVDYISHLLKEKIHSIKGSKKSVLIIDDLDRIDPEHSFRLLNVISAYFEKEHENKFGFDLIIIVADYSNLKSTFHHKYGANTDFAGYMDKFFSTSPYHFDNRKAILNVVDDIAKSIKNEEPNLASAIGDNGYIKLFLRYIFTKTVEANAGNLRQLLKHTKYQLPDFKSGSYRDGRYPKIKTPFLSLLMIPQVGNFAQIPLVVA